MSNIIYIGTSIDGYIADKDGGLEWLESVPNPNNEDLGMNEFYNRIDGIVMGKNTYETVASMDIEWPYPKPVFVLSRSLKTIPDSLKGKVEIIEGSPKEIIEQLNNRGLMNLYIDGGMTIQSFLKADLIDEMIISRIPILVGGGIPLFSDLPNKLMFKHVSTDIGLNEIVISRYKRIK